MTAARSDRGAKARLTGRRGEVVTAPLLMAKGYRIRGFRRAAPQGQLDLLALKGDVLAVVGVRRPVSLENALEAVHLGQRERRRRADAAIAAGRPALKAATIRPDLIALAPGRLPRHIPDVWRGS